jgi:hypothetical protein
MNTCSVTQTIIFKCYLHELHILQRPPYSPDLSPSDYHVFGSLKDALRGSGAFLADGTTKNIFFSDRIKKLVQRCEKCIEKKGDYVEK